MKGSIYMNYLENKFQLARFYTITNTMEVCSKFLHMYDRYSPEQHSLPIWSIARFMKAGRKKKLKKKKGNWLAVSYCHMWLLQKEFQSIVIGQDRRILLLLNVIKDLNITKIHLQKQRKGQWEQCECWSVNNQVFKAWMRMKN